MSKQESVNKLNGRDFINIGIYTAIYFVIVMVLAMTGLIPIFLVLLSSMRWNPVYVVSNQGEKARHDPNHEYDYGYFDVYHRYDLDAHPLFYRYRFDCRVYIFQR